MTSLSTMLRLWGEQHEGSSYTREDVKAGEALLEQVDAMWSAMTGAQASVSELTRDRDGLLEQVAHLSQEVAAARSAEADQLQRVQQLEQRFAGLSSGTPIGDELLAAARGLRDWLGLNDDQEYDELRALAAQLDTLAERVRLELDDAHAATTAAEDGARAALAERDAAVLLRAQAEDLLEGAQRRLGLHEAATEKAQTGSLGDTLRTLAEQMADRDDDDAHLDEVLQLQACAAEVDGRDEDHATELRRLQRKHDDVVLLVDTLRQRVSDVNDERAQLQQRLDELEDHAEDVSELAGLRRALQVQQEVTAHLASDGGAAEERARVAQRDLTAVRLERDSLRHQLDVALEEARADEGTKTRRRRERALAPAPRARPRAGPRGAAAGQVVDRRGSGGNRRRGAAAGGRLAAGHGGALAGDAGPAEDARSTVVAWLIDRRLLLVDRTNFHEGMPSPASRWQVSGARVIDGQLWLDVVTQTQQDDDTTTTGEQP